MMAFILSDPNNVKIPSNFEEIYYSNKTGTVVYKINHKKQFYIFLRNNFVHTNPIAVANQIVDILIMIIIEVEREVSTPASERNLTTFNSVNPTPPGINDNAP